MVDFLSILRVGSEGTDGLPGSALPFASPVSFLLLGIDPVASPVLVG